MCSCWTLGVQSPPPSSFGGFERSFEAALFFFEACPGAKQGLTPRYFFNKITRFRRFLCGLQDPTDDDILRQTARSQTRLVSCRRERQSARTARRRNRTTAERQAQTRVYPSRGHRRLYRRGQCRQASHHRQQGGSQDLLPPQHLSRRRVLDNVRENASAIP